MIISPERVDPFADGEYLNVLFNLLLKSSVNYFSFENAFHDMCK